MLDQNKANYNNDLNSTIKNLYPVGIYKKILDPITIE